jgi:hypothetical protein
MIFGFWFLVFGAGLARIFPGSLLALVELTQAEACGYMFLYLPPFFLGAGASCLHIQPVSPHSGHFFGLQRVSTTLPHFSQVKVAM